MRQHYRCARLVSERELFTGRELQGLRDLLRGIKPTSLQEKTRVRMLVIFTVKQIEEELEPYGGLQTLRIGRSLDGMAICFAGDNI